MVLFMPVPIFAGDMNPPGPPGSTIAESAYTWSKTISGSARWESALGGTAYLDRETGVVWAANANLSGQQMTWYEAMDWAQNEVIGGRSGWRLPTVEEMQSLVDMTPGPPPKMPIGHPFANVQNNYWTMTQNPAHPGSAQYCVLYTGEVQSTGKNVATTGNYVWAVRCKINYPNGSVPDTPGW
jgi:hypothetical protein